MKFIGTFLFLVSLFVADNFWGYMLATVFLVGIVGLSKVPVKFMLKGLKPLFLIFLITLCFNLFLVPGRVIWEFGFLKLTYEGIRQAVKIGIRLIYLVIGSSVMTLTTTPNQLTDGLEKILKPLNKDVYKRQVAHGDMVTLDFEGFVDGVAFEGGKGTDYPLTIGSNSFIPGFEDQLVGAELNKEVEVNVTFPEDYHANDLDGKMCIRDSR